MAGGPPFYCPVLGKDRRRGNDRLGAGAYRGSRRRLRHSISVVGAETPSTKKRPLGPAPFTSRQRRADRLGHCVSVDHRSKEGLSAKGPQGIRRLSEGERQHAQPGACRCRAP